MNPVTVMNKALKRERLEVRELNEGTLAAKVKKEEVEK
jgi:hypothetical protein